MKLLRLIVPVSMALLSLATLVSHAQEERGDNVLQWSWRIEPVAGARDEVDLVIDAQIRPGWILYSSDFAPTDFGPKRATIIINKADGTAVGDVRPIGMSRGTGKEPGREFVYTYFAGKASLRQRVRQQEDAHAISGVVSGQACLEESGLCTLVRQAFSVTVP